MKNKKIKYQKNILKNMNNNKENNNKNRLFKINKIKTVN